MTTSAARATSAADGHTRGPGLQQLGRESRPVLDQEQLVAGRLQVARHGRPMMPTPTNPIFMRSSPLNAINAEGSSTGTGIAAP